MKTHNLIQGSAQWHAYRATHFNASDAPAMLGISPYKTRSQLLHEIKTGLSPEVNPATQRLFDSGHDAEAAARPIAEREIGEDLFPQVGSLDVDGLPLSASFDGLTMDDSIVWEHKLMNVDLADSLARGIIPDSYHPQLEQQLLISGAEKALFMATSPCKTAMEHVWYTSNPELRQRLIDGWKQFAQDLATFVPEVAEAKPEGRTPETLPALRIEVTGMVTASNLAEYKAHALAMFDSINRDLKTDQDFADAKKAIKWAGDIETRLEAAKAHALSQTESIDKLFSTIDDITIEARRVRLDLTNLVKVRDTNLRAEIVTSGKTALIDHIADCNIRIGRPLMPAITADFAAAIKGMSKFQNMRDAVATALANAKIEANAVADKIAINLRAINEQEGFGHLFYDQATLSLKDPEFVAMAIKNRIADHKAAEAVKEEMARARIQAEEQARADAEIAAAIAKAAAHEQAQADAAAKQASDEAIAKAAQPAPIVVQPAQQMPPVQFVEQALFTQPEDTGATMRLGQICEKLGFNITADFLSGLGFEPCATEKAAKLYRTRLFPLICRALVKHINSVSVSIGGHSYSSCDVKKFEIEPQDGGVMTLTCSISVFPNSADVSDLAKMVQDETQVSIEGPPDLFDKFPEDALQAAKNLNDMAIRDGYSVDISDASGEVLCSFGKADPMYDQAVAVVRETKKPSISLVQRHLKIGYNRAARLLESMEEAGVVSPMGASGVRTIL